MAVDAKARLKEIIDSFSQLGPTIKVVVTPTVDHLINVNEVTEDPGHIKANIFTTLMPKACSSPSEHVQTSTQLLPT